MVGSCPSSTTMLRTLALPCRTAAPLAQGHAIRGSSRRGVRIFTNETRSSLLRVWFYASTALLSRLALWKRRRLTALPALPHDGLIAAAKRYVTSVATPLAAELEIHSKRKLGTDAGDVMPPLRVYKLSENAVLPMRGSDGAAGYDLSAAKAVTVAPHGKAIIPTDLAMAIPAGCYGRIAPRSSMAWKKHTDVGAGVVDMDYRGPVGVVLFNLSHTPVEVAQGERVAQLVLERIATPEVVEVSDVSMLETTKRGAGGYGSTGA